MDKITDRIAEFAKIEGVSIGTLEKQIGASQGVLTRAIRQKTDIQSKWISLIQENYPLISAEWLLTGKGEMLKSTGTNVASGDHAIAGHNNAVINMGKEAQDQELETLRQENIELRITIAAKDAEIRTLRDMIALLAPKP